MPAARLARGPTLVLLPGAALGSWIWKDVLPHLDHPTLQLELPGAASEEIRRSLTLQDAVQAVAKQVEAFPLGGVVLVGHSIGGLIASGAASRAREHVRGVVYVGSYLPRLGGTALDAAPLPQRLVLRAMMGLKPGGVTPPAGTIKRGYCNDLDDATTARVLEHAHPDAPRLFTDAVTWDPYRATGAPFYVRLRRDREVPLRLQESVLGLLPEARVDSMDTGHLPMLAEPEELATILNAAAAHAPAFRPETVGLRGTP